MGRRIRRRLRLHARLESPRRPGSRARPGSTAGLVGAWFRLAPSVGEVVADEIVGRTPEIDVSPLAPDEVRARSALRLAYGPGARAPDRDRSQRAADLARVRRDLGTDRGETARPTSADWTSCGCRRSLIPARPSTCSWRSACSCSAAATLGGKGQDRAPPAPAVAAAETLAPDTGATDDVLADPPPTAATAKLVVHVVGAVRRPGLCRLPEGSHRRRHHARPAGPPAVPGSSSSTSPRPCRTASRSWSRGGVTRVGTSSRPARRWPRMRRCRPESG